MATFLYAQKVHLLTTCKICTS